MKATTGVALAGIALLAIVAVWRSRSSADLAILGSSGSGVKTGMFSPGSEADARQPSETSPPDSKHPNSPKAAELALDLQEAVNQQINAAIAEGQGEEPHDPNVPNAGPDLVDPPPDGQLGLNPKYLAPVPAAARPSPAVLANLDAEAERVRRAQPKPPAPDPDLLVGMLEAISQVTQNPALRHALINSYLDQVMGLTEREATEARSKLAMALHDAPDR